MPGELPVTGGSPAPAAGTPAAAAGAAPLTLDLEDIKFSSNTLQVQADTPTVIKITNQGATTHNFSIDALKINTGDIQPGQTVEVTINAPAGTYTYYCNVPGHEAAGMKGTLTVAGGSPPPAAGAATPPAATTAPPAAAAGQVVNLDMVDINFDPKTLEIPANTDVTIHITNKGVTAHDFSIDELKISTGEVAPGATIDVKINAPAGTYKYFCNVPGHEAAGMVGELTVK